MKIALLYFSGTGNTKWLSEILSASLIEKGGTVSIFNLEDDIEFDAKDFDSILVAHPVYGAHVPRLVSDRVQILIQGNIPIIVIATFGYVNALGYFAEKKALGRTIHSYYNIKMFNNISTPKMKIGIKTLEKRLSVKPRLIRKIESISTSILQGKRKIEGIGPQLLVGIKIRKIFRDGLHTHYQTLGVDAERCTDCGKCIRECSTHSIVQEGDIFTFHATCTACMRCYNNCPTQAITINGVCADPEVYTRYLGPWE
ncbi:MAG: EFR1 family ferrodoxin [Candidatus Marinimicrobia bacterium]|nr:EFR1 family ferrodoxin [Candidatus Neomarinimicrobiota bacterium]